MQVGTLLKLSCKLGYRLLRPNNATFRCDDEDAWDGGELAILRQKCVKVRQKGNNHLHLDFSQATQSVSCSEPEIEKEGQKSKISRNCWAVLTSLSVFLPGLWASPLLLFSARKLA